jgi:NTE family protein
VGAPARAAVLSRTTTGQGGLDDLHARVTRWGARFDGRLRVCAVDRATGRRTVFGAPGAPTAAVADAVCASCSIPWVYEPVTIDGREYVDGGAWTITNMDAVPAGAGAEVLCLDPTASLPWGRGAAGALRAGFRLAAALEVRALRRRGARVTHVWPDTAAAATMGADIMDTDIVAPALAAGYRQGRGLA